MSETLSPLVYGTVIGRFMALVADSDDPDTFPDAEAMSGTITFTASAEYFKVETADPVPTTVFPSKLVAGIDGEGYLCRLNNDGTVSSDQFLLMLATNDPSILPTGFEWIVTFELNLRGEPVQYPEFRFELASSTTVDLTPLAPVADSGAS